MGVMVRLLAATHPTELLLQSRKAKSDFNNNHNFCSHICDISSEWGTGTEKERARII